MDYLFIGQKVDLRPLTGLTLYDTMSQRLALTAVSAKGVENDEYPANWVAKQLEILGYPHAVRKGDNEKLSLIHI